MDVSNGGEAMRHVVLMPGEPDEGGFYAFVPSLPGCYGQGETREETLANIKEAIELHIESMIEGGEEVPEDVAPIEVVAV
jgi:predicted RNase H-like HicB family nuclease